VKYEFEVFQISVICLEKCPLNLVFIRILLIRMLQEFF